MIKFGLRLLYVIMIMLWLPLWCLSPIFWIVTGKPVMRWYRKKFLLVGMLMK